MDARKGPGTAVDAVPGFCLGNSGAFLLRIIDFGIFLEPLTACRGGSLLD